MKLLHALKLCILTGLLAVSAGLAVSTPVMAQREDVCEGLTFAGSGCGGGDAQITNVVQVAINILSLIGGIAAVLVIIVSGIRLITSAGNSDGLATARNGVIYAIVGLIIIAPAQAITRFVLGRIA